MNGEAPKKAEEKTNDLLHLDEETDTEPGKTPKTTPEAEVKTDNEKKSKLSIQLSSKTLETIKTFVSLGLYDSVDEFIGEAVGEKSTEMIGKVKNSLKRNK